MATLNDLAVSVIKFGDTMERVNREIKAMNDKQPKVWLTIEEAKILLECACCVDAYTFAKCKKLFDCLKTRIELAEKSK